MAKDYLGCRMEKYVEQRLFEDVDLEGLFIVRNDRTHGLTSSLHLLG